MMQGRRVAGRVRPATYEEWYHCITVDCGIELTPDVIAIRVAALQDGTDSGTRRLREMWGLPYVEQLVEWFEQAGREPPSAAAG